MVGQIINLLPPWLQPLVGLPTLACTLFTAGLMTFTLIVYSDKIDALLKRWAKVRERKELIKRMYPKK